MFDKKKEKKKKNEDHSYGNGYNLPPYDDSFIVGNLLASATFSSDPSPSIDTSSSFDCGGGCDCGGSCGCD